MPPQGWCWILYLTLPRALLLDVGVVCRHLLRRLSFRGCAHRSWCQCVSCIPHAFIAGAARCILACLPESSAFLLSLSPPLPRARRICVQRRKKHYVDLMPVSVGDSPCFVPQTQGWKGRRTVRTAPKQLCLSMEFLWWELRVPRAAVDGQIGDQVYEHSCWALAVDSLRAAGLVAFGVCFALSGSFG